MKCQKCNKFDAVTHITEIINGTKTEMYLCKYCGDKYHQEAAFHSIFKSNFDNFFGDLWNAPVKISQTSQNTLRMCPNCKTTLSEIQSEGRLGCSECYSAFSNFLLSCIKNIHQSTEYKGKSMESLDEVKKTPNEIEQLKAELSCAVKSQNFEKAAELRDKIREMEA